MVEYFQELLSKPYTLYNVFDYLALNGLCLALWVLGFPVFLFIQWLRGEFKWKDK